MGDFLVELANGQKSYCFRCYISEQCKGIKDVKDLKVKFETFLAFPRQFIIQYEHKAYNIMVDLDEPDQLLDRRSNKLLIVSDDSDEDSDNSGNTKLSSESESLQYVSLFIK